MADDAICNQSGRPHLAGQSVGVVVEKIRQTIFDRKTVMLLLFIVPIPAPATAKYIIASAAMNKTNNQSLSFLCGLSPHLARSQRLFRSPLFCQKVKCTYLVGGFE